VVTSYTIYYVDGMSIPYSLTITDTPGYCWWRRIGHSSNSTHRQFLNSRKISLNVSGDLWNTAVTRDKQRLASPLCSRRTMANFVGSRWGKKQTKSTVRNKRGCSVL